MPAYNTKFDLTVADIDLIETALRAQSALHQTPDADTSRDVQDLLGRLHNQKIFYRPKSAAYVSS